MSKNDAETGLSNPQSKTNSSSQRGKPILDSNQNTDLKNPCMHEQKLSYKCLSDNGYNRDLCSHVFANYKKCIEFWSTVRQDRRNSGIKPELPPPAERQKIKEDYLRKSASGDSKT